MKPHSSQIVLEYFNYTKFLRKFYGEYYSIDILPFVVDYYQEKYPCLSPEHIKILICDISSLLVGIFADNHFKKVFNHYFKITKLLKEGLSEELYKEFLSTEDSCGRQLLSNLKAYKEADEHFVVNKFADMRKWRHPSLAVVDNPGNYVPMLKEFLQEQSSVILSYIYNYLKIAMPENVKDKKIIIPLPPAIPLKASYSEAITEALNVPKAKQVKFLDAPVIHPIPKHNKGEKIGRKRLRGEDIIEQSDEQAVKKICYSN